MAGSRAAAWQQKALLSGAFAEQTQAWRERLVELPGPLDLPVDLPPTDGPALSGRRRNVGFPEALTGAVHALARREGVTPFMVLLAAYQVHGDAGGAHHGAEPGAVQDHTAETVGPVALGLEPVPTREPAGLLGAATVAVEMVTVLALTALLPARWRSRVADALLLVGAATWVLWLTGVLA